MRMQTLLEIQAGEPSSTFRYITAATALSKKANKGNNNEANNNYGEDTKLFILMNDPGSFPNPAFDGC